MSRIIGMLSGLIILSFAVATPAAMGCEICSGGQGSGQCIMGAWSECGSLSNTCFYGGIECRGIAGVASDGSLLYPELTPSAVEQQSAPGKSRYVRACDSAIIDREYTEIAVDAMREHARTIVI